MTPLEAIYFAAVTMSTVGYGDYAPSQDTPYGMVATVFLILFGIIFVFAEISKLVTMLVSPIFEGVRHVFDRLFPQESIDLDGDGGSDFKVPRGPIVYYGKNLIAPMVIIIGGQFLWAQFYVMADPTWEYPVAVYHCFTTMTTVGYGDVRINVRSPIKPALLHHTHMSTDADTNEVVQRAPPPPPKLSQTDNAKIVCIFHITFSVSLLGALISEIFKLMSDREEILKRAEMLKRRLDPELIKSLDKDGAGVDKTEFVVGMLVKLELVREQDVMPYLKQFATLDADGSGVLTAHDLEAAALALQDKVAGRAPRQGRMDRSSQGSRARAQPPPSPTPSMRSTVEVELPVRFTERGLGISIDSQNVITALKLGGPAENDKLLRVGDVVVKVDGCLLTDFTLNELVSAKGQEVYQFTIERKAAHPASPAGRKAASHQLHKAAVAASAATPPRWDSQQFPSEVPSRTLIQPLKVEDQVLLRTIMAYIWGTMGLPRDRMIEFTDLVATSIMTVPATANIDVRMASESYGTPRNAAPVIQAPAELAFAWGTMGLPRDRMLEFMELVLNPPTRNGDVRMAMGHYSTPRIAGPVLSPSLLPEAQGQAEPGAEARVGDGALHQVL